MAKSPAKNTAATPQVLPDDVAGVYKPGEGVLPQFACEFGNVDLTTINMEFADRLFAAGYLVKQDEA